MLWIGVVLVVAAVVVAAYALLAARTRDRAVPVSARAASDENDTAQWIADADRGYDDLSEAAKCDLVFAMGSVNDARANVLLVRALDDPSEAVALAAAHALHSNGNAAALEAYSASHPERGQRLLETVNLLSS